MKNGIILSAIVFTFSLTACSNYLEEFEDEYRDSAYAKTDIFSPTESSASIIDAGDSSGTSSKDASSSDARAEGQSSGKTDEEYDCYMNDSACISKIANEFDKTVRLLDSRNNNVYTAIYVGGLYFETALSYGSIFDDSVSFLLMTENLEYEGDSVTALDTNGVFFYTYENAEKACPTGWRLPKITPEWSFLLKGDGHQFNIELPDDEKGCYTDGKFDSGKSIFYWAQKEGETSWFVKKSYLTNDYVLHEYERCNTFPVRCVKEFGRHADYAGSSSSSGETKSSSSETKSSSGEAKSSSSEGGSSSITTCDDFFDENALSLDSVLDSAWSNIPEAFSKGWINVDRYCVDDSYNFKVTDITQFCVEYTDDSKDAAFFYGYQAGANSSKYNHVILTSPVFNADTSCSEGCQINCFEIPNGKKIKRLYVKGHEAVANSSSSSVAANSSSSSSNVKPESSSEPATTCPDEDDGWHTLYDSSDSDQINGNPFQEYEYRGYIFEGSTGSKNFSEIDSICIEYKKTTEDVKLDATLGVRLGCYNDSKKELKYQYVVPIIDNQKFNKVKFSNDLCDTENSHEACNSGYIVYMELPNPELKNVTVQKIMYKGKIKDADICNSNALYGSSISNVATCFADDLSGSASGTLLYDASKGDTLTNGENWIVSSKDQVTTTFQSKLMNVVIESSTSAEQPYFAFNANPTGENEAVDISDWGGLCLVYASNVPLELRTDVDGSLAVDTFPAVTTPSWQCIDWPGNANLTNVSQLKLTPVDANGITPVVYIQKVYTRNKTVKVLWKKEGTYEDGYVKIDDKLSSSSKSIAFNFSGVNISLFDSATVDVDKDEILQEFFFYKKENLGSGASSCRDGGYCTDLESSEKKTISLIMYDSDNQMVSSDELAEFPVLGAFFSFKSEKTSNPINSITLIPKSWYAPLSRQ